MLTYYPIGYIHNSCTTSQAPEFIKQETSEIDILPEYAEGLLDIEQSEYIDLIFSFHQEKQTELLTKIRTGETRGIFASRSPRRPNHLGVTTVKLLKREGNKLYVRGADALNDSPLLDIKYCDTSLFNQQEIHQSIRIDSPRIDIIRQIIQGDTRELLLKAAQLHGHICPGLSIGIMSATHLMQQLYSRGENTQDYTLTLEMQNCPADGALFITGCTPGTRRLTIGNPKNKCFYLKNKKRKGWKVTLKESAQEYLRQHLPDSLSSTEKGLATLRLDLDKLSDIEEIQ